MSTIQHAVFGEVVVDESAGVFWEGSRALKERIVQIDLTIDDASRATREALDKASPFVAHLADFEQAARAGMRTSVDDDPEAAVTLYLEHHLDELSDDAVLRIFGKPKDAVDLDALVAAAYLRRVGLYPCDDDQCAAFDFTIGDDETQYLVVVYFDSSGNVSAIEMES
jgi:hypothetical protein